eukprot:TRINITY_DN37407_c0_g1_i1.p1 TRINITY_DN37407_c0_g1~~TRINITY_DN37407_c0_g1_i1.p1  ORF type:complete len:539 (-),score=163.25 TRINITY_DN37407_c0_g1_i1:3-1619(-)
MAVAIDIDGDCQMAPAPVAPVPAAAAPAPAAPAAEAPSAGPTPGAVKRTILRLLPGRDLATLSLKTLRKEVEERLRVPDGGLLARKEEMKAVVQAFIQQQQAAPAAVPTAPVPAAAVAAPAATPVAPAPAASSATVTAAVEVDGASGKKRPLEEGTPPAAAPPPKKKQALTGNRIFSKEKWVEVSEELQAADGVKPHMGKVMSTLSARWKALPKEDQDRYEAKAKEANEAAAAAPPETAAASKPARSGKGKGRGRGSGGGAKANAAKGENEEPEMTRVEFQQAAETLQCAVNSLSKDGVQGAEVMKVNLVPRAFKTGTMGWFYSCRVPLSMADGRKVNCQVQFSVMASGSKSWRDGDGYKPEASPADPNAAASDGAGASASAEVQASEQPAAPAPATAPVESSPATAAEAHPNGDGEAKAPADHDGTALADGASSAPAPVVEAKPEQPGDQSGTPAEPSSAGAAAAAPTEAEANEGADATASAGVAADAGGEVSVEEAVESAPAVEEAEAPAAAEPASGEAAKAEAPAESADFVAAGA